MCKLYRYTFLLGMLAVTASCSKSFLEIKPKGRVIASKTSDYDLMLNNLDVIVITGADSHVLPGDELCVREAAFSTASLRDKKLFAWDLNDMYLPEEDARETLTPVRGLYIYNKIIAEVMASTDGSELTKKSIQAEAMAGRAWTYLWLVNLFGKPYNAATAATDPAFPLITTADVNGGPYKRATVQQLYDLIVSDLTTAIPNLSATGVPHRSRMSKAAAQGLLAKVYIFMGKFAEALPLLNESISNLTQSAVPTSLVNYNTAYPGFPTAVNDVENVYAKVMTNVYNGNQTTVYLKPETLALYDSSDVRLLRWMTAATTVTLPNGVRLARRSNTTVSFWGVRVSELYLFRAELKARAEDLSGAVSDLEYFRSFRMPAAKAVVPAAAQANKMALLQFIMEERIREYVMQGFRWFDMRRLSVDPLFGNTLHFTHPVYDANGNIAQTFVLNNVNQFVYGFSAKIVMENPGINNP